MFGDIVVCLPLNRHKFSTGTSVTASCWCEVSGGWSELVRAAISFEIESRNMRKGLGLAGTFWCNLAFSRLSKCYANQQIPN